MPWRKCFEPFMALNGLLCADVPQRNYKVIADLMFVGGKHWPHNWQCLDIIISEATFIFPRSLLKSLITHSKINDLEKRLRVQKISYFESTGCGKKVVP